MAFDDDTPRGARGRPMAGSESRADRPAARDYGDRGEGRPGAFAPTERIGGQSERGAGHWSGGEWRDPATPATWQDPPTRGDWGHYGGPMGDRDQGRISTGGAGMAGGPDPYGREAYGGGSAYGGSAYGGAAYGGSGYGGYGGYGTSGAGAAPAMRGRRGPKNWQRSDERIREDLCDRLVQMHDIDSSEVEVAVAQGCVTLSGTVPERAMKHRIEDCADACPGVTQVDNYLRVRRGRDTSSRGGLMSRLFGFSAGANARDVMTPDPMVVSPSDTVDKAARMMRDADIGAIPVCDGQRLQGMLTDRDIALRVVAADKQAQQTKVSEVMSADVFWCWADDDIDDVMEKMGDRQVRRIPVIEREDRRLVGIVSLGDVATATHKDTDDTLQAISAEHRASNVSGATTAGATKVTTGSSAGLSSGSTSGVNSGI